MGRGGGGPAQVWGSDNETNNLKEKIEHWLINSDDLPDNQMYNLNTPPITNLTIQPAETGVSDANTPQSQIVSHRHNSPNTSLQSMPSGISGALDTINPLSHPSTGHLVGIIGSSQTSSQTRFCSPHRIKKHHSTLLDQLAGSTDLSNSISIVTTPASTPPITPPPGHLAGTINHTPPIPPTPPILPTPTSPTPLLTPPVPPPNPIIPSQPAGTEIQSVNMTRTKDAD